jgi:hypothetical protein
MDAMRALFFEQRGKIARAARGSLFGDTEVRVLQQNASKEPVVDVAPLSIARISCAVPALFC